MRRHGGYLCCLLRVGVGVFYGGQAVAGDGGDADGFVGAVCWMWGVGHG